MERDKVASFCNSPPYFDGTNYAAWREKFEIFLDALDEHAYDYLTKEFRLLVKKFDGEFVPKPRIQQSVDETFVAKCDKKAKNVLITALFSTQFSHIQHIPTAKHAWDKLRVVHEGDDHVRILQLKMVLVEFEELRMSSTAPFLSFMRRFYFYLALAFY